MKTKILILALIVLALPTVIHAQKVKPSTRSADHAMIDCSGFKTSSKTPKKSLEEASDIKHISNPNDLSSPNQNEHIYFRFEISNTISKTISWAGAMNVCKSLSEAGSGQWRLPTFRELMLILVLRPEINKISGVNPITYGGYWSASGDIDYNYPDGETCWGASVWEWGYVPGPTQKLKKPDPELGGEPEPSFARCIREIP